MDGRIDVQSLFSTAFSFSNFYDISIKTTKLANISSFEEK